MRLFLPLTLVFLTLSLEGCPATNPSVAGSPPPTALQTFNTLYANAVSIDDLVIKEATIALNSGLISTVQAKKILAITDSVKTALDAANSAAQIGNTGIASGNLAQALGPIAILSACLTSHPLTIATFDVCTVKLTPAVQS